MAILRSRTTTANKALTQYKDDLDAGSGPGAALGGAEARAMSVAAGAASAAGAGQAEAFAAYRRANGTADGASDAGASGYLRITRLTEELPAVFVHTETSNCAVRT